MPSIPPTLSLSGTPSVARGRRLLASKAFRPGDLIATFDEALVAIPDSAHLSSTCSWCLSSSSESSPAVPVRACTGCRATAYCSAACQRADWARGAHKGECKVFQRVRAEGRDAAMLPTPVRALVRLLLLLATTTTTTTTAQARPGDATATATATATAELECHVGAFRDAAAGGGGGGGGSSERWRDMELQALAALHYMGKEASPGSVAGAVEILCKMQVNSFNMADVDVGQSGLFLHSALAMVNHSCIPNAFVQFAGRRAILRAYRAIEKDEEVEISYIECTLHRSHRQEALKSRYHFDCICPHCRDDLDVYQVCRSYPHLELNSFSLTPDIQVLRKPHIQESLNSNISLQRNVEEIYPSCSTSLQGIDSLEKKKELRRRWNMCKQLREAEMFAVEPLSQVLVETSIYFGEQGDFPAALAISCFIALQVDPYRYPMPFAAQRVKGLLMIARILTNTAPGIAEPPTGGARGAARTRLSEILAKTDQVTMCHAVLVLVIHWGPAAHSPEWEVCSQARDLLKDIQNLPGRENEYAMVEMFSRNPSGPDENLFFEIAVLRPMRELSEIALDIMALEFES